MSGRPVYRPSPAARIAAIVTWVPILAVLKLAGVL